jgi:hypothetical protein
MKNTEHERRQGQDQDERDGVGERREGQRPDERIRLEAPAGAIAKARVDVLSRQLHKILALLLYSREKS